MTRTKRIGPKMEMAAHYVATHPGCSKAEVSYAVGPHNSNAYGYWIVQRAMAAGLVEHRDGPDPRRYYLYAVDTTTQEG